MISLGSYRLAVRESKDISELFLSTRLQGLGTKQLTILLQPQKDESLFIHMWTHAHTHTRTPVYVFLLSALKK